MKRGHSEAQSIYVYAAARGTGRLTRYLEGSPMTIVTTPDCHIEGYLRHVGARFEVVAAITDTREYKAIEDHYDERVAARSGVPLMHHIDEGLQVLAQRNASTRAMKAFSIHPLVQEDGALATAYPHIASLTEEAAVLTLALEYRNIANSTLSTRAIEGARDIPLSPLTEVNEMLIADKLQNWKDFVLHHRSTHPRSTVLDRYFAAWHERLGVISQREQWFEALQITPVTIPLREIVDP